MTQVLNQLLHPLTSQCTKQSVSQSIHPPMKEPISQLLHQARHRDIIKFIDQSTNRSLSYQSANQLRSPYLAFSADMAGEATVRNNFLLFHDVL